MSSLVTLSNDHAVEPNPFDRLVEAFIEAQDVSDSSRATYRRQIRQFVRWLHTTGRIAERSVLTSRDILDFKQDLVASKKSSYTVSAYLTVVRSFFRYLESLRVYPNIARNIKGAKRVKGFRKDCLTPSEIRHVLASIDTTTLAGLRDYAIVNVLARTGLRTVEIARASVGDVRNVSGQAVLWVMGKGRETKDEFVLLVDAALSPIQRYLHARGEVADGQPLFASCSDRNPGSTLSTRSISRLVKNALKQAGFNSPRLTAHSLRHTAITLAIKNGAPIHQVQSMARHASINTTMVYSHNLNRIEDGAEWLVKF